MTAQEILKLIETVDSCEIDNCGKKITRPTFGWCESHYYRYRKYGSPYISKRKNSSDLPVFIDVDKGIAFIQLSNGGNAIIDIDDVPLVEGVCWSKTSKENPYVRGYINGKSILLHRLVTACPKGMCVDHINHDILDNRKSNLRICTKQQNLWNLKPKGGTSKFKGVSWRKQEQKWKASICKNGKREAIGLFDEEIDAAIAHDRKAEELFGEYAKTNKEIIQAIEWERNQG